MSKKQVSTSMEETVMIRMDSKLKSVLQKLADKDKRKLSDFIRVQLSKLVV